MPQNMFVPIEIRRMRRRRRSIIGVLLKLEDRAGQHIVMALVFYEMRVELAQYGGSEVCLELLAVWLQAPQ